MFMFLGSGHDVTVTDFNPDTDKLDFENTLTPMEFSNVVVSPAADGSAILQVNGNTVQLAGVSESQVTAGYVEFNRQEPAMLSQQIMAGPT
jgi:hypothetical protein